MRATALLAAAVVLFAACGDSNDGSARVTPAPTSPPLQTPAVQIDRAADFCAAVPEVAGAVESPDLVETSGLAASRRNEDVLWAHNDSGHGAIIYAIGSAGEHLASYTLAGVDAVDWEDMAVGPGPEPGVDYLYLADFGDNDRIRSDIAVYRVPEPIFDAAAARLDVDIPSAIERLVLTYPGPARDAEVLLVDPDSGDLVVVTKEFTGPALVFVAPSDLAPDTPHRMEAVAEIDFPALGAGFEAPPDANVIVTGAPHLATGGDVSPDGAVIAIRTYGLVWVWNRPADAPLWQAFEGEPCRAPAALEEQGETLAFDADGSGYTTISEGDHPAINRFETR